MRSVTMAWAGLYVNVCVALAAVLLSPVWLVVAVPLVGATAGIAWQESQAEARMQAQRAKEHYR